MPKVKQVNFDLNAINNELTGESSDLHREIMDNLIEEVKSTTPVPLRILNQPKAYNGPLNVTATFRVDAIGVNLTYRWQYSSNVKPRAWNNLANANNYIYTRNIQSNFNKSWIRCIVTDKYGNTKITNPIQVNVVK